ncbi:hypothetical protein BDV39DRAFT_180417 [Aspergillus sergii]|uniref:Uncharacterized protein n=1 Tax=Aspergillus sergii TaxID=1034303 RepID=A0A5N6WUB2_9EURO|nr:hypothetical protein BDV39DRAFT_180417 [Aspergillus sergii]
MRVTSAATNAALFFTGVFGMASATLISCLATFLHLGFANSNATRTRQCQRVFEPARNIQIALSIRCFSPSSL